LVVSLAKDVLMLKGGVGWGEEGKRSIKGIMQKRKKAPRRKLGGRRGG